LDWTGNSLRGIISIAPKPRNQIMSEIVRGPTPMQLLRSAQAVQDALEDAARKECWLNVDIQCPHGFPDGKFVNRPKNFCRYGCCEFITLDIAEELRGMS